MKSRLIVAAGGIPLVIVLTVVQWNGALLFALMVAMAIAVAAGELFSMQRSLGPYVPAGMLVTLLIPLCAWRAGEGGMFAALITAIPLTMVFASLSVPRENPSAAIASTMFGILYLGVAAGLLVVVRTSPHGAALVLILLLGTWMTDTGAYFTGRALGRHPLAPRISPNKTIEGLIGGLVFGIFLVWYAHFITGDKGDRWLSGNEALVMGIGISIATVVGDLFESMLKRSAGVKDSSHLLGDHGGMLDRLDALLLAAPVLYVCAFLVGVL